MRALLVFLVVGLLFSSCQKKIQTDILTDERDGQNYPTVKIGDQWWMAKNLAYMPFVVGLKSDSGIWVYGYDGASAAYAKTLDSYTDYGCLYSWAVAMNISEDYLTDRWTGPDEGHQGICPDGWHLPSDREWQVLEDYLDTAKEYEKDDERQNSGNSGNKIKADTTWTNYENLNESGFGALATGFRWEQRYFLNRGKYAYFWTSTEKYAKSAWYRYLWNDSPGTFRGFPLKINGLSVRCVMDD